MDYHVKPTHASSMASRHNKGCIFLLLLDYLVKPTQARNQGEA